MIGRSYQRIRIQRTCRNDDDLRIAGEAGNRASAAAAEPFGETLGPRKIKARDHLFPGQPSELPGINSQIGGMARAGPFAATRAVAMNHPLKRRTHLKRHCPAQAAAVNIRSIHTPSNPGSPVQQVWTKGQVNPASRGNTPPAE